MKGFSNGNGEVWDKATPLRYVAQVIRKLKDGTYPTVPTKCFCGSDPNDTILIERDRYTIPHRMVMCESCLLIRANPRMTEEAYRQFYNDEYRMIYDGFAYQEKSENDDFLCQEAVTQAYGIKNFLRELDEITPKSVVDIGSDKGGTLVPFKEDGAVVYGVEICEKGREYSIAEGIPTVESIDELIDRGIKVDLVIMHDIIEHYTDLSEVAKVKKILNPEGKLFIYTPGLLASPPFAMFQNAHTYQFIGATLEAIMARLGFLPAYLDDRIVSVWDSVDPNDLVCWNNDTWYPLKWRVFIQEHLAQTEKRRLPPVRTHCKFGAKSMFKNLEANLALRWPNFSELKNTRSGDVIILGAGPTVDGQLDKIKELVAKGYPIVTIERMYPWCSTVGLKPEYVVALDASENVEEGFVNIQPETTHLICATIHPKILPILNGFKKYIWSGSSGNHPDALELWRKYGYERLTIVNTGGTVVLGSMYLSLVLGFRNVHMFGFDLMVANKDRGYASGVAGESVERSYKECTIDGETILTCTAYLAFAQQFFDMVDCAKQWKMLDTIEIYGESLVNKMWDHSDENADGKACQTTLPSPN